MYILPVQQVWWNLQKVSWFSLDRNRALLGDSFCLASLTPPTRISHPTKTNGKKKVRWTLWVIFSHCLVITSSSPIPPSKFSVSKAELKPLKSLGAPQGLNEVKHSRKKCSEVASQHSGSRARESSRVRASPDFGTPIGWYSLFLCLKTSCPTWIS